MERGKHLSGAARRGQTFGWHTRTMSELHLHRKEALSFMIKGALSFMVLYHIETVTHIPFIRGGFFVELM